MTSDRAIRLDQVKPETHACPGCGATLIAWSGTHGELCPAPPKGCGEYKVLWRPDGWWKNGKPHTDDPRLAKGGRRGS